MPGPGGQLWSTCAAPTLLAPGGTGTVRLSPYFGNLPASRVVGRNTGFRPLLGSPREIRCQNSHWARSASALFLPRLPWAAQSWALRRREPRADSETAVTVGAPPGRTWGAGNAAVGALRAKQPQGLWSWEPERSVTSSSPPPARRHALCRHPRTENVPTFHSVRTSSKKAHS